MTLTLEKLVLALPGGTVGPLTVDLGPGVHHLRGENGSGKTTLLRALCTEVAPTSGRVLLDGETPSTNPLARRRISFLPAVPELPGFLTVREAWVLFAALRDAPSWSGAKLAAQFSLDPSRRLDTLSIGQRKKAELLAALAGDPDVLLLDEVFAPLDPRSAGAVAALLEAERPSKIMVMTGHGALGIDVDSELRLGAHGPDAAR